MAGLREFVVQFGTAEQCIRTIWPASLARRIRLVIAAVEKVAAPKNRSGKHGHAVKREHGFFAVMPAPSGASHNRAEPDTAYRSSP